MILLYGGNGYIGRHIAAAAEGREAVTIVSSRHDGAFLARYAPSARFMSVRAFFSAPGEELVGSARTLIHLANTSLPGVNIGTPWDELTDNVTPGFRCFFWAARANPSLRIVYASSGGTVYGDGHSMPIAETDVLEPISAYGLGKSMSEAALAYVARLTGIEYAILRIANPVGRWHKSRAQGLVEIAVERAHSGEPLIIFGDGSHVRDYFDADDLAEAFIAVATAEKRVAGVWNIGSGRGMTTLQAVQAVERSVGQEIRRTFLPPRSWDVSYSVLDVRKVGVDFGWASDTPLSQTIEKIVQSKRAADSG